ncbi:MAG: alkaline phosphatase D family protein [Bacteroidetes bacterium]|nr:alkaline phosphatase D family protein [Bacteroidota bacterium]
MRILKLIIFLFIVLLSTSVYCQKKLLQSGPMVGYSTMREVMLWVQTNSEAKVYFNYWRKSNSEEKYSTNIIDTKKGNAFTAHLIADELEPGNTYEYELLINNKIVSFEYPLHFKTQQLWQWRNDQIEWLIDALSSSSASFKFVVIGTQFLNPNPGGENHSTCPEERKKILDRIKSENINGVIFLTGDVHRAEITKIERNGTYPLYDFTLSPITAGPSSKAYKNEGRIEESLLMERNFGTIEVTGPLKNRELRLTILNKDGKEHYKLVINANELK